MTASTVDARVDERACYERQLQRLLSAGAAPVALYGAGKFARSLRPLFGVPEGLVRCFIDDDPGKRGGQWCGLPVGNLADAVARGCRGVLLTAEGEAARAIWRNRRPIREAGLYLLTCPSRFESRTWDECLLDQYEAALAMQRSPDARPVYLHGYPKLVHRAWAGLVELYSGEVRAATPAGRAPVVCEIGSGTGLLGEFLIPSAAAYHCVDFSDRLLFEAMEHRFGAHLDKLHLHHDATARLAGVPDGGVDAVLSYDVFVHVKIDVVQQYFKSIARVLRPGGRALIHFIQWDATAIAKHRSHDLPHYEGRPNYYEYLHPDQLAASAADCELGLEIFSEPAADQRSFMRLRKR